MPTLEQRKKFARELLTDPKGMRFSLEGRAWVEELWTALDGFKAWPIERDKTCDACRARVGELTLDEAAFDETRAEAHAATGCLGLNAEPILYTVLCAERRAGKSFNFFAFATGEMFLETWRSTTFVAAAKDQTGTITLENLKGPIDRAPRLKKLSKVVGNSISVPSTNSKLEIVPTSHSSITGRGRTRVVIDEARDVPDQVAVKLLPSILEAQWVACPHAKPGAAGASHLRLPVKDDETPPSTCTCGAKLQRTRGRMLIMSSAGTVTGDSGRDWFADLVEALEEEPDKNYHLIRIDEGANPMKSQRTMDAAVRVLGRLPGLKGLIAAEIGNQFVGRGEDFLSKTTIRSVVDKTLANREGSARRCVGFLDTSVSGDLTSVVLMGEDDSELPPGLDDAVVAGGLWTRAVVERIDLWDPAELEGGVIDEDLVQEHLDLYVPLFPRLTKLYVDVRRMPWAEKLVRFCKSKRSWGRKIERFTGRDAERDAAWSLLEERIRARSIRIPNHPRLLKELGALTKKKRPDGRATVRDISRKISHAELADGLAHCCYIAHLEQIEKRTSLRAVRAKEKSQADVLNRVFRRTVRGLTEEGF